MTSVINLWIAPLVTPRVSANVTAYEALLSEEERQKYHRFLLATTRHQYYCSHLLLRSALSAAVGYAVQPQTWRFTRNNAGKPAIAPMLLESTLHYNLSHCKTAVAVAVSTVGEVGIDIEELDQTLTVLPVNHLLAEAEKKMLALEKPQMRKELFIKLWTLKEAYAKLWSVGHGLDFSHLEVSLNPVAVVRTELERDWFHDASLHMREILIGERRYCVSLAWWSHPDRTICIYTLDSCWALIESDLVGRTDCIALRSQYS